MKVLFNATPLTKGGALTVAASFVLQTLRDASDIEWSYAVSRQVHDDLRRLQADLPGSVTVFDASPGRSLRIRAQLEALERGIRPDVVFTLFGPTYVRFQAPHLLGCANPWLTHPSWAAYRTARLPLERIQFALIAAYQRRWLRHADAWVAQTETGRQGLHRLGLPLERIDVVLNTCDQHYLTKQEERPFPRPGAKVRLLCFSAPYRHKNLVIVPRVAKRLAELRPELDFQFVLTLPPESDICRQILSLSGRLGVTERIENLGPIPLADGPGLYRTCHVCFLPTLLETFSATYPESMAMGLPIVTTDLDFARDACRDAALYYACQDAKAAAERIAGLLDDRGLWESLVARGKVVLAALPSPAERYQQYVACVRKLARSGALDRRKRVR